MLARTKTDLVLGVLVVLLSAAILAFWIPADIETGIFEKVRRRTEIGDSFAPVLAVSILGLGGLLLIIEALKSPGSTRLSPQSVFLSLGLLGIFIVAVAIMRWAGPLAVQMLTDGDYRPLRDTRPWKYVGFVAGGTFLVTSIIMFVEHKATIRAFVIGLIATLFILVIYDLPFDDLLLPPNGDV